VARFGGGPRSPTNALRDGANARSGGPGSPPRASPLKGSQPNVDSCCVPEQLPIDRAFFRAGEDGATVFFPWGLARRGYRLPGADAKRRASRAVSLFASSPIAIGTWTAYALQPLFESEATGAGEVVEALVVPGAALLVAVLLYWLWVSRFVEKLPETSAGISREERLREAAELAGPWKIALVGASLCGLSALLIWLRPQALWLGLLGIALGAGALVWSARLRRAVAAPPS
jgi:hypothetical protein